MTLDVIIATLGIEGIRRVSTMQLPPVPGVKYIISWQQAGTTPVPPSLKRDDIEIYRLDSIGLSRNRNNALDHSQSDIRLIADDDLSYTAESLLAVVKAFETRDEMDIACFRYNGPDNKTYPPEECDLQLMPKNYYVTSFEMAIRNRGKSGTLRYDERFGLGSGKFTLGEENELMCRARRFGLNIRFIPITITSHPGLTSGLRRIDTPNALAAQGAVIAMEYPLSWPLRTPLKAWRLWRQGQAPFWKAMLHGVRGSLWTKFHS